MTKGGALLSLRRDLRTPFVAWIAQQAAAGEACVLYYDACSGHLSAAHVPPSMSNKLLSAVDQASCQAVVGCGRLVIGLIPELAFNRAIAFKFFGVSIIGGVGRRRRKLMCWLWWESLVS